MKTLKAPPREPDAPLGCVDWNFPQALLMIAAAVGFWVIVLFCPSVGG